MAYKNRVRIYRLTSLVILFLAFPCFKAWALGEPEYVSEKKLAGAFPLVRDQQLAELYIDKRDHKGVARALGDLQLDIERVSGSKPQVKTDREQLGRYAVIVGTLGLSPLIDELANSGKVEVSAIRGKWEAFQIQVVSNPVAGVDQALLIIGADRRGTTFGIYDLSEQIGVSPWYYWADVPVAKKENIYIKQDTFVQQAPGVKYRGIFLNDEAPALTSWVNENYGNYNHEFYVKVFELLLRLKANFLWPAMWNNAFADDDPQNMILADKYGIVMGTSHHEPMMRADKEWNRHGKGDWEYSTNAKNIYPFWEKGVERNKNYDSIYTLGMRGQNDKPMSEGENIGLLENIVADQRKILGNVFSDSDVSKVPQVWCLYKEVQAYYEKGMRVPEDVILLWSDDNWGNIRRLPSPEERKRKGGAGVYYHFDYVGGPRSYRWINTIPIAKIWEQMHLAWEYDATQIWITNVGDLKPMEFPIEFFLRMAWNPQRWGRENIQEFGLLWAEREFGKKYAAEIESLLTAYTRHNGRRKPELLAPASYSLLNYDEAERIDAEMQNLLARAEKLDAKIPEENKNAFFQLVLHPIKASANLTRMYIALGKNRLYAMQGRANANEYADQAKRLFAEDNKLKQQFHTFNNGKWNGFMNQSHIGYRSWNNPEGDQMPVTFEYKPGNYAEMGVAVEGVESAWPAPGAYKLVFDQAGKANHWIEIFNRGTRTLHYTLSSDVDWLVLSNRQGDVEFSKRIQVHLDWQKLPVGNSTASISVRGTGWASANIRIEASKHSQMLLKKARGFIEADGYIAIEAASFSQQHSVDGIAWKEIPLLGRSLSSVSTFPTGDKIFEKPGSGPYLEYEVSFLKPGEVTVYTMLAPTWPLMPGKSQRYALAFGNETPRIVDPLAQFNGTDGNWEQVVSDGVRVASSQHHIEKAGPTTLRIYMIDPAVTIQKIVVDSGGLKESYLGPPQSVKK